MSRLSTTLLGALAIWLGAACARAQDHRLFAYDRSQSDVWPSEVSDRVDGKSRTRGICKYCVHWDGLVAESLPGWTFRTGDRTYKGSPAKFFGYEATVVDREALKQGRRSGPSLFIGGISTKLADSGFAGASLSLSGVGLGAGYNWSRPSWVLLKRPVSPYLSLQALGLFGSGSVGYAGAGIRASLGLTRAFALGRYVAGAMGGGGVCHWVPFEMDLGVGSVSSPKARASGCGFQVALTFL
ncbi:MAG: hypothetical protein HY554_03060 [Elusimicrobia bacterium]|nr:hypothetical protein [Elusimicrobiota bacterium]